MMTTAGLGRLLALVAAGVVICPLAARCQVLTSLELSLSNPGARSMGFGGAFVGLADDATAAFANPAGLVQISRPEVALEGRSWSYGTLYTRGGRAAGEPTGFGIDTVAQPLEGESETDLTSLSFVSYVYPHKGWSLAFFQHRLLDFEAPQEIQGIFFPGNVAAGTARGPIERARFDLEIVTRGLAAGFRVGERLSLGLGLSHFDPAGGLEGREYLWDEPGFDSFFARASFLPERRIHRVFGRIAGHDWGLSAGFLWRVSDYWKVGGAYRQGPELEIGGELEAGPAHPSLPPGAVVDIELPRWEFPSVYALGVSYRSRDERWVVSFEWDRVEYSVLLDAAADLPGNEDDVLEDGNEFHLGAEYAFLARLPIVSVRLGAWHDPDHRIRTSSRDPFARAEQPGGEDEVHVTMGLGLAFSEFQLDLAMDLSERSDTVSLSAVYSF